MRKRLTAIVLALVLVLTLVLAVSAADIAKASTQSVEVDGTPVEFQMYALVDANGGQTNYVKLRDVAHVLNSTPAKFSVGYDGTISITTGEAYTDNGSEMTTPYSGDRAYKPGPGAVKVNGADVSLDAIVLTDDNGGAYTYFKLRDLGTALGFKVDWTGERGVFIETGAEAAPGQIVLADLQGIWHLASTKDGKTPLSNSDIVISSDQYFEYSAEGKTCMLRSGTITDFTIDTSKTYPYTIAWSGVYQSTYGGTFNSEEMQENLRLGEINLTEGYFVDTLGLRYEKVTSSEIRDKVTKALEEVREAEENKENVYDFLAAYVKTNGKLRTYGDFNGQYACYLDILGSLSTNKSWTYQIYADPDTGLVTLGASFSSYSGGDYSISSGTFYSLELSRDGGPYRGSFRDSTSTSSILGGWTDTGTFQVDPAGFTHQTKSLSFDSYESEVDSQSFNEQNGAVHMKIWLMALRDEILKPNGYTLADLGFSNFS